MILIPWQGFYLQITDNTRNLRRNGFTIIVPWSEGLGCFARLTWWPETLTLVEKIKHLWKFPFPLWFLLLPSCCSVIVMFLKNCYFKVKNNDKLGGNVVYQFSVRKWVVLLFHLLFCFWCQKIIIFRETSCSIMVVYLEQTLTIFDGVLLEEAVHVQLGHHGRKSQKDWKKTNSVLWKKVKVCRLHQLWAVFLFFHGIRLICAS